jgi:uncharacterized phage-associated protein
MANVTAKQVADYLVWRAASRGDLLTNLKLQKLLYYAQGWWLALEKKPLFGERIEAWPMGPVQPGVYGAFKVYGWKAIDPPDTEPKLPKNVADHLDEVVEVYGSYTGVVLSRMTHQEKPWGDARLGLGPEEFSNNEIAYQAMQEYFASLLPRN